MIKSVTINGIAKQGVNEEGSPLYCSVEVVGTDPIQTARAFQEAKEVLEEDANNG